MPQKSDHLEDKIAVLTSPKRYESLDPQRVMSAIPMLPYQVIADIGCGPGYFTVPMGKYVFSGKVYALDVQQEMLDAVTEELKRIRLTNVETRLSDESKLPLEDSSLDGVLAALVMHEADDPKALLQDALRCMRRGAWIALIEWRKHDDEDEDEKPVNNPIEEAELLQMAKDAGLRLTSRHDLNNTHYMLLMRK